MTDNEIIKVGYIYAYFYDNQNTSFSIVEVVRELSDEVVVVKFHQVFRDDSGNGFFNYLCDNDKTMNVSKKYLHKIDLINSQKAEIEENNLKICHQAQIIRTLETALDNKMAEIEVLQTNNHSLCLTLSNRARIERNEAIKAFADRLKEENNNRGWFCGIFNHDIDNLLKETIEGSD